MLHAPVLQSLVQAVRRRSGWWLARQAYPSLLAGRHEVQRAKTALISGRAALLCETQLVLDFDILGNEVFHVRDRHTGSCTRLQDILPISHTHTRGHVSHSLRRPVRYASSGASGKKPELGA